MYIRVPARARARATLALRSAAHSQLRPHQRAAGAKHRRCGRGRSRTRISAPPGRQHCATSSPRARVRTSRRWRSASFTSVQHERARRQRADAGEPAAGAAPPAWLSPLSSSATRPPSRRRARAQTPPRRSRWQAAPWTPAAAAPAPRRRARSRWTRRLLRGKAAAPAPRAALAPAAAAGTLARARCCRRWRCCKPPRRPRLARWHEPGAAARRVRTRRWRHGGDERHGARAAPPAAPAAAPACPRARQRAGRARGARSPLAAGGARRWRRGTEFCLKRGNAVAVAGAVTCCGDARLRQQSPVHAASPGARVAHAARDAAALHRAPSSPQSR